MESLRSTPVQPERLPNPRERFDAGRFFANKDRLARLSTVVALTSTLVAIVALGLAHAYARRPVLFVVLDPNGNSILAPGARFEEATELHVQQALQATGALLNRNPQDFDQPEVLRSVFSPVAFKQATELKASEAREFEDRQIEQKPHVTRIDAIGTRQGEVQVQVAGDLARWGRVDDAPFVDSVPFTLRLTLRYNADLLSNRRQPTVVDRFTLTYDTPHP